MILRINRGYFPVQHLPIDLCNGNALCFFEVVTEFLNVIWMNFVLQRVKYSKAIDFFVINELLW
jgi:hypothetical protein